ncbi:MAG TPA: sulfatase-like hydrolase/transferase [Conexibacter sp.]|nr:sulfatase-like hydrolase/transferase [Conexibacter sp.]
MSGSEQALTRRGLLRRGGGVAGAAALGATGLGAQRAQAQDRPRDEGQPNVVLIVADRLRADAIHAYDDIFDDRYTDTPNIDALADDSLRFRYAVPDGMPAIPMRRGLMTGMRSYPFRDWRAAPGMPAIPGWGKVYDFQPLLPELTAAHGVKTVYVTDNPTLSGPRFASIRRTGRLPSSSDYVSDERSYFLPLRDAPERQEPTQRVLRAGGELLSELRGDQPFFLALDAFNPVDAFETPRQWVTGRGPVQYDMDEAKQRVYMETLHVKERDGLVDSVRDAYGREVRAVDAALGRFMNQLDDAGLADRTVVIFVGDSGIALGEQGTFGHPAGMWHRRVYHVPLMIKDPAGRWAGDTSSWFVSSHDIPPTILGYLGITTPGKMAGEDLTTLLDDDDLPPRPYFTTAIDSHVVIGDRNWLLIGRTGEDRWRLYETEEEDEPNEIDAETVDSPTVLESLKRYGIAMAGGTLPEFGDDAALRPPAPRSQDKKVADDGTLDSDEQEANELR